MAVGQVHIARRRAVSAVSEQLAHLGQLLAGHDGVARYGVPKVVQAQPAEVRPLARRVPALRGAADAPTFGKLREQERLRVARAGQRVDVRPRRAARCVAPPSSLRALTRRPRRCASADRAPRSSGFRSAPAAGAPGRRRASGSSRHRARVRAVRVRRRRGSGRRCCAHSFGCRGRGRSRARASPTPRRRTSWHARSGRRGSWPQCARTGTGPDCDAARRPRRAGRPRWRPGTRASGRNGTPARCLPVSRCRGGAANGASPLWKRGSATCTRGTRTGASPCCAFSMPV